MIAVHICGGNLIRAHSAFPMELLALCMDLAFQKHTDTTRRIVSDCQAAITLLSPCMQEEHGNIQSRTHSNITMACHRHLPAGAHIEKVKAHVERRKQARGTWTFEETGNFIADIVAGSDYQDKKLAQEGLQPVTLCIPAVELLQQLVLYCRHSCRARLPR